MKIQDLGKFDTPVLLFGGCYSNFQATAAMFDWAQKNGFPPHHMIHTGDIVAYCASPNETVQLMREHEIASIKGNCEIQLSRNAPDCGCGFDDGTQCDLLSVAWYNYAVKSLSREHADWMGELPDWITFEIGTKRFVVIHGGAENVSQFIWSTDPDATFQWQIKLIEDRIGHIDGVVAGHSGIAFHRRIDVCDWINAGVIGMPANNGAATTEFVTLSAEKIEFHSLSYDAVTAMNAMEQAGLTQGYHRSLSSGFWPSQDVLPPQLRRFERG